MKYIYTFGNFSAEGNAEDKNLLGGKGANLAEMTNLGIPVPPGFTISTEVCTHYMQTNSFPKSLEGQVEIGLHKTENTMDQIFGNETNPLLVSALISSLIFGCAPLTK